MGISILVGHMSHVLFFGGYSGVAPPLLSTPGWFFPEAPGGVGIEGVQVVTLDHPIDSTVDTYCVTKPIMLYGVCIIDNL